MSSVGNDGGRVQGGATAGQVLAIPAELNPDGEGVRYIGRNPPLFCLADLCKVLGHNRPDNVRRSLDPDYCVTIQWVTPGGIQPLVFVTEPGFYQVVIGTTNARYRPFRKWLFEEVLPSIREHGCYPAPLQRPQAVTHPWSTRLRGTVVDHHQYILRNIGKAYWSVFTHLQTHMLITEDEFIHHQLPMSNRDLPDGSAGKMWSKAREGRAWAKDVQYAPLVMPGSLVGGVPIEVPVKVYHPDELQHFNNWFYIEYLPDKFPNYLRNKQSLKGTGFSPVSAADHVNLRVAGVPADLTPRERGAITAAGGFIPYVPRIEGT